MLPGMRASGGGVAVSREMMMRENVSINLSFFVIRIFPLTRRSSVVWVPCFVLWGKCSKSFPFMMICVSFHTLTLLIYLACSSKCHFVFLFLQLINSNKRLKSFNSYFTSTPKVIHPCYFCSSSYRIQRHRAEHAKNIVHWCSAFLPCSQMINWRLHWILHKSNPFLAC